MPKHLEVVKTIPGRNLGFMGIRHAASQAIDGVDIANVWIITVSPSMAIVISKDNIYILKESEAIHAS